MLNSIPSSLENSKIDKQKMNDIPSAPIMPNPMLAAGFLQSDLKIGLVVKAKWNGENATIKDIKDGYVFYSSHIWKPKETFKDKIEVFLECFKPVK